MSDAATAERIEKLENEVGQLSAQVSSLQFQLHDLASWLLRLEAGGLEPAAAAKEDQLRRLHHQSAPQERDVAHMHGHAALSVQE